MNVLSPGPCYNLLHTVGCIVHVTRVRAFIQVNLFRHNFHNNKGTQILLVLNTLNFTSGAYLQWFQTASVQRVVELWPVPGASRCRGQTACSGPQTHTAAVIQGWSGLKMHTNNLTMSDHAVGQ